MLFAPRTKLKIYQVCEKLNIVLLIVNAGFIVLTAMVEEPVPMDAYLSCACNAALIFLCSAGITMIKTVHGLDDKGNFSFKNGEDKNEPR
jgi:hypothetical protein